MLQCRNIIEAHLDLLITRQRLGREVYERKETEKILQESRNKFKSITEYSIDGILMVDAEYHLTYVNKRVCEIMGYEESELIGKDFRKFLNAGSEVFVSDLYKRRQAGQTASGGTGLYAQRR